VSGVSTRTALVSMALAGALASAACSADRESRPGPASPAPPPARAASSGSQSPAGVVAPRVDQRRYPFTIVEVGRVAVARVANPGTTGPPPRIPWREPTRSSSIVHIGRATVRIPAWGYVAGTLGRRVVLAGDCRSACRTRPGGDLHLIGPGGRLETIDPMTGRHRVGTTVTSPDGRAVAWQSEAPEGFRYFRYSLGDAAPAELDVLATASGPAWFVRGFVRPHDILVRRGHGGPHARTSGEPATWNVRSLSVAQPGILLGEPAFTPPHDRCLSRFAPEERRPLWTRCYRWGNRAVDGFSSQSLAPGGQMMLADVGQDLVIIDARSGQPVQRLRFDDRLQSYAFEDQHHFLAVLTDETAALSDAWPEQWIIRCSLDLRCERATPQVRPEVYDMIGLMPPGTEAP